MEVHSGSSGAVVPDSPWFVHVGANSRAATEKENKTASSRRRHDNVYRLAI